MCPAKYSFTNKIKQGWLKITKTEKVYHKEPWNKGNSKGYTYFKKKEHDPKKMVGDPSKNEQMKL